MDLREQFLEDLQTYITDTNHCTETLRNFCKQEPDWTSQMRFHLEVMRGISSDADKISLNISHVKNAKNKLRAFGELLRNRLSQGTADHRRDKLQQQLALVLKDVVRALDQQQDFLDAVEKLAVTSASVFMNECFLPNGAPLRSLILTARCLSPQLLSFKRDARTFFLPNIYTVQTVLLQLEAYISITQDLSQRIRTAASSDCHIRWTDSSIIMKNILKMKEELFSKMFHQLKHLITIRMDESFRLTFLFGGRAQNFIGLFSKLSSRMLQDLEELDGMAHQLDRVKLGYSVSTVTGSSVGLVGGMFSIAGLALAPATGGVSYSLLYTGAGLGAVSGVTGFVTGFTVGVLKRKRGRRADGIFSSFMEDVQKLLDFMALVASANVAVSEVDAVPIGGNSGRALNRAAAIGKAVDGVVDAASAFTVLGNDDIIMRKSQWPLQDIRVARNVPLSLDVGNVTKGSPVVLSQSTSTGFIASNAFFICLDVLLILREGISLIKEKKSPEGGAIRSRVALWRSELQAWQRIQDLLCKGIWEFNKHQKVLQEPFNLN